MEVTAVSCFADITPLLPAVLRKISYRTARFLDDLADDGDL